MKNVSMAVRPAFIMAVFGLFAVGATVYTTGRMNTISVNHARPINSPVQAALDTDLANRNLQRAGARARPDAPIGKFTAVVRETLPAFAGLDWSRS